LRAVLLAAGRGVRMGGATPKSLLPLDGHEPLMFHLLAGFRQVDIDDLLVVTGWRSQDVQNYVTERFSGNVTFVRNARYASWGNFHSLRVAIDASPGMNLLVVNSDIVITPEVLARVAEDMGDLVLAVERRHALDMEEMRVTIRDERVVAIGKDLDMARSHGEFAGVSLLRPSAAELYTRVASALEWTAETSLYYEDVYARLLDTVEAGVVYVEHGEYAEVDTPEDVPRAKAILETLEGPLGRHDAAGRPA
jgi:L-glutamine-phosphate cytidylyltransferase